MAISRLYPHAAGDLIEASEWNEEVNAIITEINSKPDADGTPQNSLNADLLDGQHLDAAGTGGGVPQNNGTLMKNLNAELIGGLSVTDLQEGAFPTGTRMVFAGLSGGGTTGIPEGWTDVTPTSGSSPFTLMTSTKDSSWSGFSTPLVGDIQAGDPWDVHNIGHNFTIDESKIRLPYHQHNYDTVVHTVQGVGSAGAVPLGMSIESGNNAGVTGYAGESGISGTIAVDGAATLDFQPSVIRVEIGEKG
jgi:hypothetical protein